MPTVKQELIAGLDCCVVTLDQFSESPQGALILCHGYGAPGTDLVPLAGELASSNPKSFPNLAMVFPAAPLEIEPGYDGRAWWPIDVEQLQQLTFSGDVRQLANMVPDELPNRRDSILALVDQLQTRWKLPDQSIFVGGFSQGAMLATDVMLHTERTFGGLIVWSGSLINHDAWRSLAIRKSPFSVVQSHGYWDPILPFQGAVALRDLLQSANHSVDFIAFQGYHAIPPAALNAASNLLVSTAKALRSI